MNSKLRWLSPVLVIAVIYSASATSTLAAADNGEFVIIGALGGVPHPPGYPLFALLLRLANFFTSSPIHAASILTALLGTGAVAFAIAAARAFGASDRAAMLGGVWYGLSTQVWYLHTHAEAFALNNLVAAAIIWAAAPGGPRGERRVLLLGLLAGLGISNHHSIVLMAPLGLWGVWQGLRESKRVLLALVGAVLLAVVGLTPYLWLLTQQSGVHPLVWGDISGWSELWAHFTRADYGTLTLAPNGQGPMPMAHLGELVFRLVTDFHIIGIFAVVAGFRSLLLSTNRATGTALLAAFVLAGPLFAAMFNIPLEGVGGEIVRRFHVLPETILAVPLALGVDAALVGLRKQALIPTVVAVATLAVIAGGARLRSTYTPTIRNFASNVLRPLPPDALLLVSGDAAYLGAIYAIWIDQERTDVNVVSPSLLRFDWYRGRVERRLGYALPVGALNGRVRSIELSAVVDEFLEHHRMVFHVDPPESLRASHPHENWGITTRLLTRGSKPNNACDLVAQNEVIFSAFVVQPDPPGSENLWGRVLWRAYPRAWLRLRELHRTEGGDCGDTIKARLSQFHAE